MYRELGRWNRVHLGCDREAQRPCCWHGLVSHPRARGQHGLCAKPQILGPRVRYRGGGDSNVWMFSLSPVCRVWATCDAANLASARVLEKLEMTREGVM